MGPILLAVRGEEMIREFESKVCPRVKVGELLRHGGMQSNDQKVLAHVRFMLIIYTKYNHSIRPLS